MDLIKYSIMQMITSRYLDIQKDPIAIWVLLSYVSIISKIYASSYDEIVVLTGFSHPHSPCPSMTAKKRSSAPDKATNKSRSSMRDPSQNTLSEYDDSEIRMDPLTGCVSLYSPFRDSIDVNPSPRFAIIASSIIFSSSLSHK